MAKISATVVYTSLLGDHGSVEGVEVTCTRCNHTEESFGTGDASLIRCAALLRENCPRKEKNFYKV